MNTAAALADHDLSPEAVALLRAGAEDGWGICCRPGEIRKNFAALHECARFDLIRFLNVERPVITEAGRRAIGAPTELQADRARRNALLSGLRKPRLKPEKRDDPRDDFDYRSYKSVGYVCTLVVRQPDPRENPQTIRVGKTLTSDAQYLGGRNSIVQPESEGRFVLTLVPSWMTRPITKAGRLAPAIFSSYPLALDETDPEFTDEERQTWERLRMICHSINARINSAGRRTTERRRFGEYA